MRTSRRKIGRAGRTIIAAGDNLLQTGMAATAAGQVIASRMALGAAAMRDPAQADLVEFTRMFTEKAVAMATASQITALRATQMAQSLAGYAMAEAALTFTQIGRPFAAGAWYERAMTQSMALAHLAVQGQGAAMKPLYRKAAANARRLSRR